MNNQDAIEMLKSMLPEKISYAELIGASSCYGDGGLVYADPEPYAIETAISALEKTSDKNCSMCIDKGKCAIHDNFNIDYCSDWRCEDEQHHKR